MIYDKVQPEKNRKFQKMQMAEKFQKDASGKNLKIRKCENVQAAEKFENRTIPKNARDKK